MIQKTPQEPAVRLSPHAIERLNERFNGSTGDILDRAHRMLRRRRFFVDSTTSRRVTEFDINIHGEGVKRVRIVFAATTDTIVTAMRVRC